MLLPATCCSDEFRPTLLGLATDATAQSAALLLTSCIFVVSLSVLCVCITAVTSSSYEASIHLVCAAQVESCAYLQEVQDSLCNQVLTDSNGVAWPAVRGYATNSVCLHTHAWHRLTVTHVSHAD